MTNQQFNKILACVECGIKTSIAMRRLFGTQADRPKLTRDQYKKIYLANFLKTKFYDMPPPEEIDYDLIEYLNKPTILIERK